MMRTLRKQKFRRSRSFLPRLAVGAVSIVSMWFAMTGVWKKFDHEVSPNLSSRLLFSAREPGADRGPGYQEGLVCPYCRSSFIQPRSKRTCEQRIERLLRQNNGLGAIGAKLNYLEAAIAVAAREDLSCQRCDPAACSDEDKRFYHMDRAGPKLLQIASPVVQVDNRIGLSSPNSPDFSQMRLVNPSCQSIPQGQLGDSAAFLCLFSLIDSSCMRDQKSTLNATHYLGISVLDANLASIGKDGVFEAQTEWSIVTDEHDLLYLASASNQIPLVISDHFDNSIPSVIELIAASSTGTVSLGTLASLPLERYHRVDFQQLSSTLPSFGTSNELEEDEIDSSRPAAMRMGAAPIAIACCAEATWDSQKISLGIAGYRKASSIFAMNGTKNVVALTGKFCFTPDCNSHRIHSISRNSESSLLVTYEERCSSMLMVLDTADVLQMLFSPHERILDELTEQ